MKKIDMPVGQKVPGYGLLNEFGEFEFIPQQKGAREGSVKLIKQSDDFTISETKNLIVLHVRLKKCTGMELLKTYMSLMNKLFLSLKDYEF